MIRKIKNAKLGEKSIIRTFNNLPQKFPPRVRVCDVILENPELLKGQKNLGGGLIESPMVNIKKMETLITKERFFVDREAENMAEKEKEKRKPIEFFREGAVSVSVWKNKGSKGDFNTFSMTRSYKKGDNWAYTPSMGTRDLPNAVKALQRAIEKYKE